MRPAPRGVMPTLRLTGGTPRRSSCRCCPAPVSSVSPYSRPCSPITQSNGGVVADGRQWHRTSPGHSRPHDLRKDRHDVPDHRLLQRRASPSFIFDVQLGGRSVRNLAAPRDPARRTSGPGRPDLTTPSGRHASSWNRQPQDRPAMCARSRTHQDHDQVLRHIQHACEA